MMEIIVNRVICSPENLEKLEKSKNWWYKVKGATLLRGL